MSVKWFQEPHTISQSGLICRVKYLVRIINQYGCAKAHYVYLKLKCAYINLIGSFNDPRLVSIIILESAIHLKS